MSSAAPDNQHESERREALESLERLRDNPTYAGSAAADAAKRAARHFAGHDAHETVAPDAVELWGRRIGRTLSLVGCVGLAIYLVVTYWR